MQALFRISVQKSGFHVDHPGGAAPKSGKASLFIRLIQRLGKTYDDGTE